MNFSKIIFLVFIFGCRLDAASAYEFYGAPLIGATSSSDSNGDGSRATKFSYGAESSVFRRHFGVGLNYLAYTSSQDRNSTVGVSEDDKWVAADLKYKILNEDLSPYVFVGAGSVFETVTTQIMGQSESNTGSDFLKDVGLGLFGHFSHNFGFNIVAKYFQYSNVNGLSYSFSFGYYDGDLF